MYGKRLLQATCDDIKHRWPDAIVELYRSDIDDFYRISVKICARQVVDFDCLERQGLLDRDRERLVDYVRD